MGGMKLFNKICTVAYELAVLLTLLLAILAPIHAANTRHFTVTEKVDASHAIISGDMADMQAGTLLKLYRFNPDFKRALGNAKLEEVRDTDALISYNPATLAYPVSTLGEYSYRTQATSFDNKILAVIEIVLPLAIVLLYFIFLTLYKESPFLWLSHKFRKPARHCLRLQSLAGGGLTLWVFWISNILLTIPFVWFITKMPMYFVGYFIFHKSPDPILPVMYLIVGMLSYGYLFIKQKSPILAFWKFISYKGIGKIKTVTWKRGVVMWALHLIIAYVFAATLLGFLRGDLAAARAIGWPAPSLEAFFEMAKYYIWAFTIVGCLIGYGYSLIGVLWGKYIRNLDFTITGWLTNGFCYPLFGVIIWQMIPSFTGLDPIITDGPLQLLMLFMGLVLNLLYMFTIWNLGTMFGVMTDKGVRTWGFYSTVRHPSYTLEVLMFFVTELVGLTLGIHWLVITMYFFIYFLRSEREDNFMLYSNPDFEPYTKATPYKFIPGIY